MFVMSQDKKQIVELTGSTVMIMDYGLPGDKYTQYSSYHVAAN